MAEEFQTVPSQIDFTMVSGDSKVLRVKTIGTDRQSYPLVDVSTIDWRMAKTVRGPALLAKSLAVGNVAIYQDSENYYIDVTIDPADTSDLKGAYFHECQIVFNDGRVMTPYQGALTLVEDLIV